jgi:hypothetical protein
MTFIAVLGKQRPNLGFEERQLIRRRFLRSRVKANRPNRQHARQQEKSWQGRLGVHHRRAIDGKNRFVSTLGRLKYKQSNDATSIQIIAINCQNEQKGRQSTERWRAFGQGHSALSFEGKSRLGGSRDNDASTVRL